MGICGKIVTATDQSIINETDGLDVYVGSAFGVSSPNAPSSSTDLASSTTYYVYFGFKKKSDPEC
jgi:hypothetical protein